MSEPSVEPPLYNPRKVLFNEAMNRNWEKVKDLYENENVQGVPITRAKDTLLHVAVSSAPEKIVLELLDIVKPNKDMLEILNIKNKTGDTPLHLAAAIGLKKVCSKIAELYPDTVTSARNNLQETPLFSAVRHGNKDAFFELELAIHKNQKLKIDEKHCLLDRDTTHCRREDGNNILHYAIKGDKFGTITEPLKNRFVNYMKKETTGRKDEQQDIRQKDENKVMPICKVCIGLYSLMKHSISCIFNTNACSSKIGTYKACYTDVENPSSSSKTGKAPSSGEEDPYQSPIYVQKDPSSSSKPVAAFSSETAGAQKEPRRLFAKNYDRMILFFNKIIKRLLDVLGIGLTRLQKIKQQHSNAKKIMNELVNHSTLWESEEASGGQEPDDESPTEATHIGSKPPGETPVLEATDQGSASPVLVAAKSGITEMVETILKKYPVAVMDKDKDNKNIILLAVQFRQVHVYKYMLDYLYTLDFSTVKSVFWKVDKDENSAVHLAAMLSHSRPWSIPGAALQMQWEHKWYQYVRSSSSKINEELFSRINKNGKNPEEVFIEAHVQLVKDGSKWLTNTSQSCSVVAALVATVAFASASTVPGGVDQQSGFPVLSTKPVFQLFAISSLVALCFSVTSLVMFLAILTSRYEARDFNRGLPVKLILGLTSLFMAIGAMLVSFCAGDFFVVEKKLKFAVYPIYAVMCFPVSFFAIAQLPLYIDLIKATIKKVPERTEKMQV